MADGTLKGAQGYLAGMPCPKCGYVRTGAEANPDWQCPRCRIAYLKYRPGAAQFSARLVAGGREMAVEAKGDGSVYVLIAANVLALLIAYLTRMSLRELMLVYWIQSVIIGISSFIRILSLERFSTDNFKINNRPVEETAQSKWQVASFFAMHYGIFHVVYLMFIAFEGKGPPHSGPAFGYFLCALVFAANHGYSLLQNIRRDALGSPNIGTLMFLPYARIVPMHITILAGASLYGGAYAFALFGFLKVIADVIMHTIEHHVLAKGSVLPPPA